MPHQLRHILIFWGLWREGLKNSSKFCRIFRTEELKKNERCATRPNENGLVEKPEIYEIQFPPQTVLGNGIGNMYVWFGIRWGNTFL